MDSTLGLGSVNPIMDDVRGDEDGDGRHDNRGFATAGGATTTTVTMDSCPSAAMNSISAAVDPAADIDSGETVFTVTTTTTFSASSAATNTDATKTAAAAALPSAVDVVIDGDNEKDDDESGEETFYLTNEVVDKMGYPTNYGWMVDLPSKRGISRIVVDADDDYAARIEFLDLKGNAATKMGKDDAAKLKGVKRLRGYECGFEEWPSWIQWLPALESVRFRDNNLRHIPSWITEMKNLKRVDLNRNASLRTITNWENLTRLSITECDIRSLPTDFFAHNLEVVDLSGNRGMNPLPPLHPASPLKTLLLENCSLTTIPESYVRFGLKMNLNNNRISTLPRDSTLKFLQAGGKLGGDVTWYSSTDDGVSSITLYGNPLIFPALHVYLNGTEATHRYMTRYENAQVDLHEIPITLIGDQTAGKTSLGLILAGQISNADEVKLENRTEAFDQYEALLEGIKLKIMDLGGHEEYRQILSIVRRNHGCYVLLINPSDLVDEETMEKKIWAWVKRVLAEDPSAQFAVVVTKTDLMEEEGREAEIESLKQRLIGHLEEKQEECTKEIDGRVKELRKRIKDVEEKVKQSEEGSDEELKTKWKREHAMVQRDLSERIYRQQNPLNFNLDSITFLSSKTQEGFVELRQNLQTVISRLPKILLQRHWMAKTKSLLEEYGDQRYVNLDDFIKSEPRLDEEDVIDMLETLHAIGLIIWSESDDRKEIIFHDKESVSTLMKSLFHHDMKLILQRYAKLKGLDVDSLMEKYCNGQLPQELIESMFIHIDNRTTRKDVTITIDYKDLELPPSDSELKVPFKAFFSMLTQFKMVFEEKKMEGDMRMVFIPTLVFKKSTEIDRSVWDANPMDEASGMEVALSFSSSSCISKSTFSKCRISVAQVLKALATMKRKDLHRTSTAEAEVIKVEPYEILLQLLRRSKSPDDDRWPYDAHPVKGKEYGLLLILRSPHDNNVCERFWTAFYELASTIGKVLRDVDYDLVCPHDVSGKECHHGEFKPDPDLLNPLEKVETESKWNDKIPKFGICEKDSSLKTCFPTLLAVKIIRCLHPTENRSISPFDEPPPPLCDFLESRNLISTMYQKPIKNLAKKIEMLPVFQKDFDKFFQTVQKVRQNFEKISACKVKGHEKKCKCFQSDAKYVEKVAFLEENGSLITKGEWKGDMGPIVIKRPNCKEDMRGKNCSVTAAVRVFRNLGAHDEDDEDDEDEDDEDEDEDDIEEDEEEDEETTNVISDIRGTFEWIIMRCFIFRQLMILRRKSKLVEFAKNAREYEIATRSEMMKTKSLNPPIHPFFEVEVKYTDGSKKKAVFFFDPEKGLKAFQNEIKQIFLLPANQQKIIYIGKIEEGKVADPVESKELKEEDSLASLSLDTWFTHSIRVSDMKRDIEVQVKLMLDSREEVITKTLSSIDMFKEVIKFIRIKARKNMELFLNEKRVKSDEVIGSVCEGDICKLVAFVTADE